MPWCPKCRYEYRPEITRCPNCRVGLVSEQPEAPPRVAGWRIDEKTERYLAPIRGGFANGLQTAREAFRLTFSARKLLVVVGILATLNIVGQMVSMHELLAANTALGLWNQPTEQMSLTMRWRARIQERSALDFLLEDFTYPLKLPTGVATPWVVMLANPHINRYYSATAGRRGQFDWQLLLSSGLWVIWESLVLAGIIALIEAILLAWLIALIRGVRLQPWLDCIKSYFTRLYLLILCMSIISQILLLILPSLQYVELSGIISELIFRWCYPIIFLFLMLAPITIVGRNLGAWGGVKAGAQILWKYGWAFLAIFVIYRVIFEIITFASLASSESLRFSVITNFWGYSLSTWITDLALAFLGLWLAMCFMLLVLPKQEVAKDAITI